MSCLECQLYLVVKQLNTTSTTHVIYTKFKATYPSSSITKRSVYYYLNKLKVSGYIKGDRGYWKRLDTVD